MDKYHKCHCGADAIMNRNGELLCGLCFKELNNLNKPKIRQFDSGATEIERFGHPDFYKLLNQMAELHSRKNHDYAGTSDPLKNLRACGRLNLEPFLGVLIRLQDKWSRLEEFVNSGQLMVKNESVIDTLMDNAVYSLLAIILYQEQQNKSKEKKLKIIDTKDIYCPACRAKIETAKNGACVAICKECAEK